MILAHCAPPPPKNITYFLVTYKGMWLVGWVTGEIGLKAKAKQTRVGAEACKNLPTFKKNLPRTTDPRILK